MNAATDTALVVSPHLDDAVLSCGELIATNPGAVVVTVFAGDPDGARTRWDGLCGFPDGSEAIRVRRREDVAALHELGAASLHLPFLADQYRTRADARLRGWIVSALDAAVEATRPKRIVFPLGLGHEDHRMTRDACLSLASQRAWDEWWVYTEAMYRRDVDDLRSALALLEAAGFELHSATTSDGPALERKRAAVQAYGSQLRGLRAVGQATDDLEHAASMWRLRHRAQP